MGGGLGPGQGQAARRCCQTHCSRVLTHRQHYVHPRTPTLMMCPAATQQSRGFTARGCVFLFLCSDRCATVSQRLVSLVKAVFPFCLRPPLSRGGSERQHQAPSPVQGHRHPQPHQQRALGCGSPVRKRQREGHD